MSKPRVDRWAATRPAVEEVDEVTEQAEVASASTEVESLDQFLTELHQTTTQEENGMPPLGWLKSQLKTKSAAIRYLNSKGFSVNQIHKHLGLRYQHVRNVLQVELKRGPNEPFKIDDYRAPSLGPAEDVDSSD